MKTYWHFCAMDEKGRPVMSDGTLVENGKRYAIECEPILCERGYHGSEQVIDALWYAPGPWISKRPLEDIVRGDDKVVGKAFVQQPGVDATKVLRKFARMCALDVIHLWDAPEIVVRYLKTGDEDIRAAAWAAASAAAWDAAWAAASAAAWDAAWAAASAAAWAAARDAARDAAWAAARDAVRDAARAAAMDAAWDAAARKQNRRLTRMLNRLLKSAMEAPND
jgi:hypothetical protein